MNKNFSVIVQCFSLVSIRVELDTIAQTHAANTVKFYRSIIGVARAILKNIGVFTCKKRSARHT